MARRIAQLSAGGNLPDLDLRTGGLRVRLANDNAGEFGAREAARARAISLAAREIGLPAAPDHLQLMRLAIEASDTRTVACGILRSATPPSPSAPGAGSSTTEAGSTWTSSGRRQRWRR